MMNIKGIFAVSLIAMVAVVAGAHTSNAVAAIASQGYVDQQVGSKLSSISGSTTGSGNVVTGVSASGSTVSVTKSITAEETKNKVKSVRAVASATDTTYPSEKAVATALATKANTSALSGYATIKALDAVENTALAAQSDARAAQEAANAKVATAQGLGNENKAVITDSSGNVTTGQIASGMIANGTIVNADIAADAKIATSKISGLGTLATKNAVTSAEITDGTITNADIAADAKIATSKISGLAKVATSGLYEDLTGTPTIPTVNNGQLTINVNGTSHSFTANQAGGTTVDIDIPDEVDFSGLSGSTTGGGNVVTNVTQTNGKVSAFKGITAEVASNRVTSANFDSNTSNDTKYPTVKAVADAIADNIHNATLTIKKNGESVGTFTANASADKEIDIEVPDAGDILTTTTVTSSGTGAVLTGVSVTPGKVTLQKGNVQIPSGGQNATSYVSIWVE